MKIIKGMPCDFPIQNVHEFLLIKLKCAYFYTLQERLTLHKNMSIDKY